MQEVTVNERFIELAARKHSLDPDLLRAVIWMETTHGYYDALTGLLKSPKTIRPMNVHVEFWKDLPVSRESLADPEQNIDAGARLLARISSLVEDPTSEKILTLYNNLRADKVSEYGKTAAEYLRTKPWTKVAK